MENIISLKNIIVEFEDGERILKNISLDIKDKEFVTFLGPSGCGKTTTLRIIAGFLEPTSGDVFFDGQRINNVPPHKRNVNTVFQRYALFPHLNVYENIAFGLRVKNVPEKEVVKRVGEMLELVNLMGFEKRSINRLSGGQQQRVAIARALVNHPKVLLLDEPLGALDLKLRKEMQIELRKIQQELELTFIYVTHDQEEALTMSDSIRVELRDIQQKMGLSTIYVTHDQSEALSMSDRIVVLKDGIVHQVGTPQEIYFEPKTPFVADFIGESNIINGCMPQDCVVEFMGRRFECVDKGFDPNETVDVVIRPEDIKVISADKAKLTGIVESVVFKGVHYEMIVDGVDSKWMIHSTKAEPVGSMIGMAVDPFDIHIMKKTEDN